MAKSVKARLCGMTASLNSMRVQVNELHSLNGARNPASSMQQCAYISSELRDFTTCLEALVYHFDSQLKRKAKKAACK